MAQRDLGTSHIFHMPYYTLRTSLCYDDGVLKAFCIDSYNKNRGLPVPSGWTTVLNHSSELEQHISRDFQNYPIAL